MPEQIDGSATTPAGAMQITASLILGSTDIFQVPLVPLTSIVSKVEAANASALTASSSTLRLQTTTTAMTGFGIVTASCSMPTQTTSAGTWPTTLGSAPTFTSNFSAVRGSNSGREKPAFRTVAFGQKSQFPFIRTCLQKSGKILAGPPNRWPPKLFIFSKTGFGTLFAAWKWFGHLLSLLGIRLRKKRRSSPETRPHPMRSLAQWLFRRFCRHARLIMRRHEGRMGLECTSCFQWRPVQSQTHQERLLKRLANSTRSPNA